MSRTYTIRHHDTRGVATLVGFVSVLILSRLWWTGALEGLLIAAYQPQGEALTSTTYVVLSFAANLIYGIGTVLVAAWSGLWWLVSDIIAGVRQMIGERRVVSDDSEAVAAAQSAILGDAMEPTGSPIVEALETLDRNVRATHELATATAESLASLQAEVASVKADTPKPKSTTRRRTATK